MSVSVVNGYANIPLPPLVNAQAATLGQSAYSSQGSANSSNEQNSLSAATYTALQQVGASSASSGGTGSAAPGSVFAIDPFQAVSSFIRDLYAALQAQAKSDASAGKSNAYSSAGLSTRLQSLVGQLAAGATSGNASLSGLQQDFTQLLKASGIAANATTLPGFLQTLAQNVAGSGNVGNVLSTKA